VSQNRCLYRVGTQFISTDRNNGQSAPLYPHVIGTAFSYTEKTKLSGQPTNQKLTVRAGQEITF